MQPHGQDLLRKLYGFRRARDFDLAVVGALQSEGSQQSVDSMMVLHLGPTNARTYLLARRGDVNVRLRVLLDGLDVGAAGTDDQANLVVREVEVASFKFRFGWFGWLGGCGGCCRCDVGGRCRGCGGDSSIFWR